MGNEKQARIQTRSSQSGYPQLVLGICFCLGITFGLAFAVLGMSNSGLQRHLTDYLESIARSEVSLPLISVVWNCFCWPMLFFLLAYIPLGIVLIPVAILVRGFLLAYAITCVGLSLGSEGVFISIIVFSIPSLFVVPIIFLIGCESIRVIHTTSHTDIPHRHAHRIELLLLSFCVLFIAVILQKTVIPHLFTTACRQLFALF